jgi:hypothetical protein
MLDERHAEVVVREPGEPDAPGAAEDRRRRVDGQKQVPTGAYSRSAAP